MTIATLAGVQLERQRAQAYADVCVADALKAKAVFEKAKAEETMALAALEHQDGLVRAVLADLQRGGR